MKNRFYFLYFIEDKRFGKIKIFEDDSKKKFMGFDIKTYSDKELNMYLKMIKERFHYNCDFLLKLCHYDINEIDKNTNIILTIYEYYDLNIFNIDFNNEKMKLLINNLIEGLNYLQIKKKFNLNLRPELIIYDNYKKKFILLDIVYKSNIINQKNIENIKNNNHIYLSPLFFNCIKKKFKKIKYNPFKSNAFSLGLILLELGLNKNIQTIYKNDKIDQNKIKLLTDKFNKKFNYEFETIIDNLLNFDHKLRFDFKNIYIILNKSINYITDEKDKENSISLNLNYSGQEKSIEKIYINSKKDDKILSKNFIKFGNELNKNMEFDENNKENLKINKNIKMIKLENNNVIININNEKNNEDILKRKVKYNNNSIHINNNVKKIYIPTNFKNINYKNKIKKNIKNIFNENNIKNYYLKNNFNSFNKYKTENNNYLFTSRLSNLSISSSNCVKKVYDVNNK